MKQKQISRGETRQKKELRAGGVALAEPAGEGGHKTAGLVV
jgi:hypothetical protein